MEAILEAELGPLERIKVLEQTAGTTDRTLVAVVGRNGVAQRLFLKSRPRRLRGRLASDLPGLAAAELRFYAELAHEVPVRIPVCHVAARSGPHWVIALEPLDPAGFAPPDRHCDRAGVGAVLDSLARMHGRYWSDPRFENGLEWLHSNPRREVSLGRRLAGPLLAIGMRRTNAPLTSAVRSGLSAYAADRERVASELVSGEHTLVHHDCHRGNLWLGPSGQVALVDWQLVRTGSWAGDVAYLLATALRPDDRRAWEHQLVEAYLVGLAEAGGPTLSVAHAFDTYRMHAVRALEAMVVTRAVGGLLQPAVVDVMVGRAAAAVAELDSFSALGLGR